jgi:Beta-lactamase enzyme family
MRPAHTSILAAVLWAVVSGGAEAAPSRVSPISTSASPVSVSAGHTTTISGAVAGSTGPLAGALIELQVDPRPYGRFINLAHTLTGADGRYSFAGVPVDRDSRFRVVEVAIGGQAGPSVEVLVGPPVYPTSKRVLAAAQFLERRAGRKAFAVVDDRGRLAGVDLRERFHSASVIKSMLLVAYLQVLARRQRPLDHASQALLYPMIHSSSNEAASAVLAIVGEGALDQVAREAGMADYESGGAFWGFSEISAADLARFFFRQEAIIPRRFDDYARWLLSTIEPSESWGIPAVARPDFRVFFKGGWLPEVEGLVNQVGRLERPGIVFALSVLTTHDPSMAYGERTIEGVTARLLGLAR